MLCLAGILLTLCLQAQAKDIQVQPNFDASKYENRWYGIAAASNVPQFMSMKKNMPMPIVMYKLNKKGGFTVNMAFKGEKGCQQMDVVYELVSPGHYKFKQNGENSVKVLKTDYEHFALEYSETVYEGHTAITAKLYGRSKDKLSDELMTEFKKLCQSLGFKDENIAILQVGEECIPGTF